ncbi:MAG: RagB/SusD family nutrient uptake outer membrane protein [Chitinophagaceae bacterium]
MKRIIYIALIGTVFGLVSSCSKKLDIKPETSIDQNDAIKTSDDVKAVLVGAYRDMGVASLYGGRVFLDQDLLANVDDIDWTGTYQGMTQIYQKQIPVDNTFVSDIWLAGYKTINDANTVLDNISLVEDVFKADVTAQAKFIRASTYFALIQIFAKDWSNGDPSANDGVPLILKSTTDIDPSSKVARSKVSEIYAQILSDLTDAESTINLPADNGTYANQIAVNAMLARVYLQKGDYENAASSADKAISLALDNNLHLMEHFADVFPTKDPPKAIDNTAEDIFSMQVTNTSGVNGYNEFYAEGNRGDISVTDDHLAKYEDGDDRINMINEDYYVAKFDNIYGNVHTIRLAEMYLIRAEANFRLSTAVGADPLDDINLIRERALLPDLDAGDLTLDAILHERYIELAFEGFFLQDIKRNKGTVGNLDWNAPELVFPIPLREIRVNANLTQNDGYQ